MTVRIAVLALGVLVAGATQPWRLLAQGQAPEPAKGVKYSTIDEAGMKEWLTYLSSDELQGRQIYTEGYGLAAGYVADHLRQWGVKPIGDHGSYYQIVKMRGYKVTNNSKVTVTVNGTAKEFKNGEHVTFPTSAGAKQILNIDAVQFVGSSVAGVTADVKGKLAVSMPIAAAAGASGAGAGRAGGGRGGGRGGVTPAGAALQQGAAAAVGLTATSAPTPAETALTAAQAALTQATDAVNQAQQQLQAAAGRGAAGAGRGGGRGATAGCQNCDIAPTYLSLDAKVTPQFTGDDTFFDFLLSGAPTKFADLKAKADKGEALTAFAVPNTKLTVTVDNTYDVVYEQLSRNVVGMVEGTDPKLKDTYVMFGAHLDHIGYSSTGGGAQPNPGSCRKRGPKAVDALEAAGKTGQNPRSLDTKATEAAAAAAQNAARAGGAGAAGRGAGGAGAAGRGAGGGGARGAGPISTVPFDQRDFISNGADDDGSGTTAELAVAKAFATGPTKPKRSIVFVWHTGEEAGLYGSHYNAEHPIVPLEKVQTVLNMDMVGRDDCDNVEGDYTNTLFIVGADRISTDLHNIIIEQNQTLAKPLALDYELNDANDPESVYTRSDHYSYAAKGIPIAFFTTGLHKDYHKVSDTVDKILFPKMAKIAQLVYETGFSIANTDKVLTRDNKGPRTGFGTKVEIIK